MQILKSSFPGFGMFMIGWIGLAEFLSSYDAKAIVAERADAKKTICGPKEEFLQINQ